jgi:hypothetical protein
MGMHGGCAPKVIKGCGRSPEGLRFELEIKSEFNWKIESHKMWRLEFVSDKIEGEDCKREFMCIDFGCPMKKNDLG